MSEIAEQEAREAAARWMAHCNRCDAMELQDDLRGVLEKIKDVWDQYEGGDEQSIEDRSVLAIAHVEELARRDAERAERLRSIDIDWLSTLGESIRDDKNAFGVRINENCTAVIYSPTAILSALKQGPLTLVHVTVGRDRLSVDVKTRGELLDWAKMAKGGA